MRKMLICSIVLLAACREGTPPYEIEDAFAADTTGRLTFSQRDDRVPVFANNDTVVYQAESFLPFKPTNGMLFAAPREGGVVDPFLDAVQVGVPVQPWLSAPSISPDGKSVAFWEITVAEDRWPVDSCAQDAGGPPIDTAGTSSVLQQAVLRIRDLAANAADDKAALVVNFEGRVLDYTRHPFNLPYVIMNTAYPFHRHYERYGVPIFRASWSPDGSRLVFSDGLRLRIWTPGESTTTVIPNTDDAILPAWSPTSDEIAFTKLIRGPASTINCIGLIPGSKVPQAAYFERTIYDSSTRDASVLQVIRPDGTGFRSLGFGEAPAWTPDGTWIVMRRNGGLARIPSNGTDATSATPIPNTSGGFEPALSRDGRWVAFARYVSPSNYDIWVAPF